MTKPPLHQYIEWDGSAAPPVPVPVGTDVTLWEGGLVERGIVSNAEDWRDVTAYLVHSYPPEDEVVEAWVCVSKDGFMDIDHFPPDGIRSDAADYAVHLRFTNGVAEIVSQTKA